MIRRRFALGLTLLASMFPMAGCTWLNHQTLRGKSEGGDPASKDVEKADDTTDKVLDVKSDSRNPRPFFKSSRLPGALSDEGSEIERDLGIQ